jgi:photosystem II stability/assembly factor-like uncharacterized protein
MKNLYTFIVAFFLVNGTMAQWFPVVTDTTATFDNLFFTSVSEGYMSNGASILKTTDGGLNWVMQFNDPISGYAGMGSIFFIDSNTGFAIEGAMYSSWGGHSLVLKTTDGGANWVGIDTSDYYLKSVFFTDISTGYIVGGYLNSSGGDEYHVIWKTTDGGNHWITQLDEKGDTLYSIYCVDANTCYAVGGSDASTEHRLIMKTTDGGANWNRILYENGYSLRSVFFTSADTGYVAGNYNNGLLKTVDGGINWIDLSCGSSDYADFNSLFFFNPDTGYVVGYCFDGSGQNIFKTTDGGLNWVVQHTGSELISVYFPAVDTGYAAGSGVILKTENGGGFPVGMDNRNQKTRNLSIKPNPASKSITVKTQTKGTLSVFNTSGQQILQKEITEPNTTVDVNEWKSGVYFVKVFDDTGLQVGKFIKL